MTKWIFWVLSLIFLTGCTARYLTRTYIEKMDFQHMKKGDLRIAIYNVKESGKDYDTDLSLFVRNKIEDELSKSSNVTLCERGDSLAYIYDEMKMKLAGLIDENKSVNEFGRMLDADYLVNGEIMTDPNGALVKLKFINATTATIDSIVSFQLDNYELGEIRQLEIRSFPSAYYDKVLDALFKDMSTVIRKLQKTDRSAKIFVAFIKGDEKKTSNIDRYINHRLLASLDNGKIPVQKNLLGDQYGFKNSLNVLEALSQVYKGDSYYIIEIQEIKDDKGIIKYQMTVKEDKIKNPHLYYNGSFFIVNNKSVMNYNGLKLN